MQEVTAVQKMPDKQAQEHIAELFKGFADQTRVQILYLLVEKEMCVETSTGLTFYSTPLPPSPPL